MFKKVNFSSIHVFIVLFLGMNIFESYQSICWAQEMKYPNRPVTMVIGWPPGGYGGMSGQLLSKFMPKYLGQPLLLEYKAGAVQAIAADYVARQDPDGYTLFWPCEPYLIMKVAIDAKTLNFGLESFKNIGATGFVIQCLVVYSKVPWRTIEEFIEFARKNPGKINYGSNGMGSADHVFMELMAKKIGIKMNHIPFKGAGPLKTAILGGHVDAILISKANYKSYVQEGMLRILARSGGTRDPDYPDVPTLKEKGYDVESTVYYRLVAPKATPQSILNKLNDSLEKTVKDPGFKSGLETLGASTEYLNSKETEDKIRLDTPMFRKILKELKLISE